MHVVDDLEDWRFANRFTSELPGDPSSDNRPRQVDGAAYSRVAPSPTSAPRLVAHSPEIAALLGLSDEVIASRGFAEVMGGGRLLAGMDPYAMAYGGHQFGNWAGQLGDGRAINLGEVTATDGSVQTIQLKGAGPTPYSRGADGRAVLRSSVREFLCSEAMAHLGVPTTRALSLVTTGDDVVRDMFYDGRPEAEPGAVVSRVAPTFVRFGTFQLPASRNDIATLRALADHTIEHHFGHLGSAGPATYAAWFDEVVTSTASLMVDWQRVGFVHGVMNTDNLSILGLTIDYGPYGWLEDYDPTWTPNTTDAGQRRYRYGNQPAVAQWNLLQLARALVPLVEDAAPLERSLNDYPERYSHRWQQATRAKLGLPDGDETSDEIVADCFEVLQVAETDMTIFFRALGAVTPTTADPLEVVRPAYYVPDQLGGETRERIEGWLARYQAELARVGGDDEQRRAAMDAVNPRFVLRNYLAQLAIDAAQGGDNSLVVELLDVLRRPYDDQPRYERFAAPRPDWARERPGCSMLSCSS